MKPFQPLLSIATLAKQTVGWLAMMTFILLSLAPAVATAQSTPAVPFTKRTVGNQNPANGVYRIKGDFVMLGNTNLTLVNYGDNITNDNPMKFVDEDNDATTFNSSMSNLSLKMDAGANVNCSRILFAGLYWMGRSDLTNNVFDVEGASTVSTPVNTTQAVKHNNTISYTTIPLAVTRQGNDNNRYPRFTFTVGSNTYVFDYSNASSDRITVSVNGGAATNLAYSETGPTNYLVTATLTTPYVLQDVTGGIKVVINSLVRDNRTNRYQYEYQANAVANVSITGTGRVAGSTSTTRSFNKAKISIKGPGATAYTTLTSENPSEILYPTGSYQGIFAGYKDVTQYVQQHGVGDYWVADLALKEGTLDGTGLHGGWSMVVVYENDLMRWRDVTLYDGYSFLQSGTNSSTVNVSGFQTVSTGDVNVKVGIIASEGERGYANDVMAIDGSAAGENWINLRYEPYASGSTNVNDYNNFFTGSIQTGGNTRLPNLRNNTGVDVLMFNLPNTDKSLLTNSQTDTRFKLSTGSDTYVWFAFAFSADAYVPQIKNTLSTTTQPTPTSVLPGSETEFKVELKNLGSEPVNNYKLVVPIPAFTTFVPGSLAKTFNYTPAPTNTLSYDPNLGPNGSIVYNYGTLPYPPGVGKNPADVLGTFTFKLKATENCILLRNQACGASFSVQGNASGVGASSGSIFNNQQFVTSEIANGECAGTPDFTPITIPINSNAFVTANCNNPDEWGANGVRIFNICPVTTTVPSGTVDFNTIAGNFPANTKFYKLANANTPEYTAGSSFPAVLGETTYYAEIPGASGCRIPFIIKHCNIPQSLTGLVWIDKDGDKTKDAGEGFFPNNTYTVLGIVENGMDSKKVIGTALVNGSGVYSLTVSGNPVFNPDFTISNPSYTLQIALTTGAPATGSTVPALPTSSAMGTAAAPINTNYYVTNPLAPDNKLNGLGIASAAVVSAPYTPITNNIGIQSPPIAQPQSQVLPKQVKNVKFYQMLPTAPSTNILDGTDLEDGILGVGTTFNTFRIQSNPTIQSATPPANPLVVKLAYDWGGDGITDTDIIDAGVEGDGTYVDIPNFNPARLYVYYESGSGNYTGYFTYSSIDGAGAVSAPVQYSFDAILPITGVELAGTYNNVKANLQWTVLSIDDVDHFEVERGNNSAGFSKVANVNVMGLSYKLSDDLSNFSGNDVFYRVKVVSKNGSISYSNVIILKKATITGLQVLPTLVQSHVQVRFNNTRSQQVTVKVMSSGGQAVMIHNTTLGIGNASINLNGFERLPNGTYNVQVFADNSVQQAKIVVQH